MSSSAREVCRSEATRGQSTWAAAASALGIGASVAAMSALRKARANGAQSMPDTLQLSCWSCSVWRLFGNIIAPGQRETGAEMARTLDRLDRKILEELQADARISNQELAKRVGL